MERKTRTAEINTWKPKPSQIYVEPDGKLFVCHFDRFIPGAVAKYNRFLINKTSYENQLELICKYTNFFINKYDKDNELIVAYYKLKYCIDGKDKFGPSDMSKVIDAIYEMMFTPSLVEKIIRMVNDNYLDDIETLTDDKRRYLKNDKKHLESLEFTNMHVKILLGISFGMKIISPVMFHYLAVNHIKIEQDSIIMYEFYKKLFDIFGWGEDYELCNLNGEIQNDVVLTKEDIADKIRAGELSQTMVVDGITVYLTDELPESDIPSIDGYTGYWRPQKIMMYTKLYVYIKAKLNESASRNQLIFDQREIFGDDLMTVINQFTKKVLIGENIVKYKFNEHWKEKEKKYAENIIGFNKTIIKFQISYFLRMQYLKNLTEVTNTENAEGLSGAEKLLMNMKKLDEGKTAMCEVNIRTTIAYILKRYDVPITEAELRYLREYLYPSDIQIQLVHSFYAPFFGSYEVLKLLTRMDYLVILLVLKKKLLIELSASDDVDPIQAAIPYMLTANIANKVSTRVIRNNRFMDKLHESETYKRLVEDKFKYIEIIKPGYVDSLISSFINTRFTFVCAEAPMLLGTEIVYNEDKISDEILYFLNII